MESAKQYSHFVSNLNIVIASRFCIKKKRSANKSVGTPFENKVFELSGYYMKETSDTC